MGRLTLTNRLEAEASPIASTLAEDVLDGLTRPCKELPAKHLYDARGSALFEAICELPEYYPTRAEREILATHGTAILELAGTPELLELGAGSAAKTRLLLDTGLVRRYLPFDVSAEALAETAEGLARDYPELEVHAIAGDFERHLDALPPARAPRLVAFLGGTIGNFAPGARRGFLRRLAGLLGPDDAVLIGTDLVKDVAVLEAAYDDAAGVTAAFNRNVLLVLNRELGADFDPALFDHVAFFDPEQEWIEMRLRARRAHTVRVAELDLDVSFRHGEELRTEISAKFRRERLEAEYAAAGLRLGGWFTDAGERFAVSLAALAA